MRTLVEAGVFPSTADRVLRRICSGAALGGGGAGCSKTVLGWKGDSGEFNETSRARLPPFINVPPRLVALVFPSASDRVVGISARARLCAGRPSLAFELVERMEAAVGRREDVSIMSAVNTRGRKPGEWYSPKEESAIDPL